MGAEPALRRSLEQPLSRINEREKPVLSGPPQECGERLFRVVFSRSVEPAAAYISDYETSISRQIPAVRRPREPPWLLGSATGITGQKWPLAYCRSAVLRRDCEVPSKVKSMH